MNRRNVYQKDYYRILGVNRDSSEDEIKKAYRRLALKYHPDRNQNDPHAEERFKEISEAYGVLIDKEKKGSYDQVRDYGYDQKYAGEDFGYAQEDIFRDIFSNPFAREVFRDLAQDFSRSGIRFDKRFFDQVFFGGKGVIFGGVFFVRPGRRGFHSFDNRKRVAPEIKPVLKSSFLSKIGEKVGKFILRKIFDFPKEDKGEDLYYSLSITPQEAFSGTEKRIALKRGIKTEKLLVRVPPGINSGTNLRLKGKGKKGSPGGPAGDLYLNIRIQ